ncbi:hypothetical protein [Streptomyces sp. NPDC020362]
MKIHDTGLFVTTAMSRSDQAGQGSRRFFQDRLDFQLVGRSRT